MITATPQGPRPSYTVDATVGPTDYSYVANVPPMAIGPMLTPGLAGLGTLPATSVRIYMHTETAHSVSDVSAANTPNDRAQLLSEFESFKAGGEGCAWITTEYWRNSGEVSGLEKRTVDASWTAPGYACREPVPDPINPAFVDRKWVRWTGALLAVGAVAAGGYYLWRRRRRRR